MSGILHNDNISLDLTHLKSGVYILTTNNNNHQQWQTKIIKQ